jgi:hypothetical protein
MRDDLRRGSGEGVTVMARAGGLARAQGKEAAPLGSCSGGASDLVGWGRKPTVSPQRDVACFFIPRC